MTTPPIIVPISRLSLEVIEAVIEDFVTREGTDYGLVEVSFEDKKAAVRGQLDRGEAVLVFDPDSETCTIALTRDLAPES